MKRMLATLTLFSFLGVTSTSPAAAPLALQEHALFAGRWVGETPVSGQIELEPFELDLAGADEGVTGTLALDGNVYSLAGSFDRDSAELELVLQDDEDSAQISLVCRGERLTGTLDHSRFGPAPLVASRPSGKEEPGPERLVVDFSLERPETVSLAGLEPELAERVSGHIRRFMDAQRAVALSAAFVLGGELLDVRSFGWEDHHGRVPATDATMYRWASISKPLTAVAALQLAEEGELDLDRDVRDYVPEFPDKGHTITARQLLCHQAGIVHYQDMRVRTPRDYEVSHPWADVILALDMFKESPLLFEPGTAYSYTTPGYVLLGAVIERAGGAPYPEQVKERICRPLGMEAMQPDRQWVDIPHRARGYHREGDVVVDSGDDDITWKLAAGGWISTVGDLARFGTGLMGPQLLPLEVQLEMWKPQVTSTGQGTGYGLGVGVGSLRDATTISHSGGQLKTSTYLLCVPELGAAVALMCNTSGTGLSGLAQELLELVVPLEDD